MRILHIATRHIRGGADRNLRHHVEWQRGRGHDVHLAVGAEHDPTFLPRGAQVHVVPTLRRNLHARDDLRAFVALRVICAGFDVVHTHESKAGILGRLAADNRRQVIVHTVHMASFGQAYGPMSRLFQQAERLAARRTDVYVFVGNDLMRQYAAARIGGTSESRLIRSPIDVGRLLECRTNSGAREQCRRAFGLRPGVITIGAVGALERRKRVDLILTRLAPLLRGGKYTLAVAGEGTERQRLDALSRELAITDSVRFLGFLPDIVPLLASLDILVHASVSEGVPQVLVQGAAAGLPIVATDVVGLGDVPGHVSRASPSGKDLLNEVVATLERRTVPAHPELFRPWAAATVEAELASLEDDLVRLWSQRT